MTLLCFLDNPKLLSRRPAPATATISIRFSGNSSAITRNPAGIGYETAKAMKGEEPPRVTDTGFYYDNIDAPEIAVVLYG